MTRDFPYCDNLANLANLLCIVTILVYVLPKQVQESWCYGVEI